ncbi:hypothetical protein [Amycolatopsis benzoatilytica]|uniref:hypothetical protein n=1 Tax=Amycolatopsis benzoatilytica TaxID=346045 RepID=UPI00037BCBD2|nr:hypothetical protein [Amycolatopsis benzoatilytica]
MNLVVSVPPSLLAAQARSATRRLAGTLEATARSEPEELSRVVAALRLLADDVAEVLPALQRLLEDGLLGGRIERRGHPVGAAVDAVTAVGHALGQARADARSIADGLASAGVVLQGLAAAAEEQPG